MISEQKYVGIGALSGVMGGIIGDIAMNYYSVCPVDFDNRSAADIVIGLGAGVLGVSVVVGFNRVCSYCSKRSKKEKISPLEKTFVS